jgi:hypothetical protein
MYTAEVTPDEEDKITTPSCKDCTPSHFEIVKYREGLFVWQGTI